MLSSKQRAKLRGFASNLDATTIIGKDGLTENVIKQLESQLFSHEIVKVSVLDGSEKTAKELLNESASILNAEEVCAIGKKFVIYKFSNKKGIKHIEF